MCIVSSKHLICEKGKEAVLPPELLSKVYEGIKEKMGIDLKEQLKTQNSKHLSIQFEIDKNGNLIRSGKNEK